jgi:hypothetical protein
MTCLRKSSAVASWLFAGGLMSAAMASADAPPRIEVTEAKFKIDLGDGRILQGMDLVGVILHLRNRAGEPIEIRIDSVASPAGNAASGVELYGLSRRNAGSAWSPLCKPGADGRALGFPLPGTDDEDAEVAGNSFSIACTAGARGKCVMLGYRPWATAVGSESLRPYFDSCVRMMRADYCGDGRSHTRAGVHVDMWDRAGVQKAQTDLPFEAAWGPDGALCLAHARVPNISTLEEVLASCPRLAAHPAGDCESWSRRSDSGALIWNRAAIGD